MNGDVVNLRQFRKRKARAQAEREAADNRVKFGRRKSEKQLTESERARDTARLEGHRLGARDDDDADNAGPDND
ncbi:MAG: protein of unknown function containing DUF4169 domain [Saliniramus fredricksonii]|uniref:DUF4169 family protein n=1 Tax=Saliniramus fredricksonii TaxID=1653334 RepID=A0A0P8BI76_9HYPH|nr:DUF4169 family protein [Saliniramus fredricksonii]KPQ08941.1 MAG: protein of unknown function containing DUF4169 domain [Saliniramus fredricksonii]SCC81011.1 protein of unknown function [Saliniramus fredricksonii]